MRNKKAGFWIKLLSRILDILPVVALVVGEAYVIMAHTPIEPGGKNVWHFVEPWSFYMWSLLLIMTLSLQFILIPIVTKGQTFGQWVTRIKVITTGPSLTKSIMKRELFFSGSWIFCATLVMIVINHTLVTNYAASDKTGFTPTTWESLRIGIVSTVGSLAVLLQIVVSISVIVRKDKVGLHDTYAKSAVVYKNKFIEVTEEEINEVKEIKPKAVQNVAVEWIK